jgi:predicted SnoaL-like aldol condensation-catalyzing enzyme
VIHVGFLTHWMLRGLKLPTALTYSGSKEAVTLDVHRTDDGKVQLQAKTGGG